MKGKTFNVTPPRILILLSLFLDHLFCGIFGLRSFGAAGAEYGNDPVLGRLCMDPSLDRDPVGIDVSYSRRRNDHICSTLYGLGALY